MKKNTPSVEVVSQGLRKEVSELAQKMGVSFEEALTHYVKIKETPQKEELQVPFHLVQYMISERINVIMKALSTPTEQRILRAGTSLISVGDIVKKIAFLQKPTGKSNRSGLIQPIMHKNIEIVKTPSLLYGEHQKINFQYELLHSKVQMFEDKFEIVFRSILENAIHFREIDTNIDIFAKEEGNFIEIEIINTGVLTDDVQKNMFTPYASGYGSKQEGLHISLAFVKSVMNMIGGEITITNKKEAKAIIATLKWPIKGKWGRKG